MTEQPTLFGDEGRGDSDPSVPFDAAAAADHIARHYRPPADVPEDDPSRKPSVAEEIGIVTRKPAIPDSVTGIEDAPGSSDERAAAKAKRTHPSMRYMDTEEVGSPAAAREALIDATKRKEARFQQDQADRDAKLAELGKRLNQENQ